MLGTVIGDMVGSVYEFKNHRSKWFEPLFHANARFTDDSVCTVAVADALVNGRHPQEALIDWCNRYAENGGWGKRFAEWFTADQPAPYGSYGNGAAMRISPVGLLAASLDEAFEMSDFVTNLTHNHPEAIASARAVVAAIHLARHGKCPREIAAYVEHQFGYDMALTPDQIRPSYVRTERARDSVPQALICALQATGFEDALHNAVSIGGDSDTIAAIAGGVAEALFGLPKHIASEGWGRLPDEFKQVLKSLYAQLPG